MAQLTDAGIGIAQTNPVRGLSEGVCRTLAGVDTGVTGAMIFIAWLLFHSWLVHEFWWAKLNVMAAAFYRQDAFTSGPGVVTLTGAAVLLLIYALLGVVFSIYARRSGVIANLFAAIGLVLVWQAFSDAFVWKRISVFALSFLPPSATLPGHLLFAISLARFPRRFRSIALTLGDPSWAADLVRANRVEPQPDASVTVAREFDEAAAIERMVDEGSPVNRAEGTQDRADPAK